MKNESNRRRGIRFGVAAPVQDRSHHLVKNLQTTGHFAQQEAADPHETLRHLLRQATWLTELKRRQPLANQACRSLRNTMQSSKWTRIQSVRPNGSQQQGQVHNDPEAFTETSQPSPIVHSVQPSTPNFFATVQTKSGKARPYTALKQSIDDRSPALASDKHGHRWQRQ